MRGNKLAGAAPALRFPPTPRLLPFHLTFFFFSPPPRQQRQEVIIHLNANLTLPLTFSGPLRGAEAGDPRSPLPASPHGRRWQEELPPRKEGQLWLMDFWCQELGPEAVRQHINCDPIIS